MIVLVLERAPTSLRGELTRWLLEPRTGVFVGEVSAMVRDKLWERICEANPDGGSLLVHTADTEQGYRIRVHGSPSRSVVDFDGLSLIHFP